MAVARRRDPDNDALAGRDFRHVMDRDAPAHIATAVEESGALDILVNDAGGPPPGASLPRFSVSGRAASRGWWRRRRHPGPGR